jgi:integrase
MLTPLSVKNARPGAARREIADASCKGLHLVVQPSGAMSWAFRYRFAGKPRKLTLGPVYDGKDGPETPALDHANTLAGARKLATDAALQVAQGIDPARHKSHEKASARLRAENSELANRDTVEAIARLFVEKHAKANNRRRTWLETARLLGLKPDPADPRGKLVLIAANKTTPAGGEVLGRWRERSIHEITRRDVRDLLDRIIARGAPGAANHTLAAVRKLFAWAAERDIIASSPCADLKPPTKKNSRDRVLADDELRLVWRGAEAIGRPFGPMIQLLALTLQRRNEVAQIDREEIDRQQCIWVIPKERVKNAQEHEVALAPATLEILDGLKIGHNSGGRLLFTVTGETPVSGFSRAKRRLDAAILQLQQDDAIASGQDPDQVKPLPPWTLHDLRRTGASGMARLGIQLPIIEKVLNHTSGSFGGVVGVYQRHQFSDEKRRALETWAQFVMATVSSDRPGNVVSLRRQ